MLLKCLFHRKILFIVILSFTIFVGDFIILYHSSKYKVMEVQILEIKVTPLKKFVSDKADLNNYTLLVNDVEKEEILNNIDNYKKVVYIFEIKNNSSWLPYSVDQAQPIFSEEMKKILIEQKYYHLLHHVILSPGESYIIGTKTIIKSGKLSDEEILEIASKDRFTNIWNRLNIL
ncbi:hypothetical protein [Thermoactinomyces mirandus]|uniref:Uncharacterized protein n=1 Tax=Thermoactinomyces mirandus TaxID=2756294 RepID=A0A7W1XRQ2_9BACL|nr:hypothetical protein [Thermoactinomyces mirandus]MBA4602039.1 hypothetical protein [Thermoactinomyces mirandus]